MIALDMRVAAEEASLVMGGLAEKTIVEPQMLVAMALAELAVVVVETLLRTIPTEKAEMAVMPF